MNIPGIGFNIGLKEALAGIAILLAIGTYIYIRSLTSDLAEAKADLAVAVIANQQSEKVITDLKNQNALNASLLRSLEERNVEMTLKWQETNSRLSAINDEVSNETIGNLNSVNADVNRMLESASDIFPKTR